MLTALDELKKITKKDYKNFFGVCQKTASKMYSEDCERNNTKIITVSLLRKMYHLDNKTMSLILYPQKA
jgi:hypothetical protein